MPCCQFWANWYLSKSGIKPPYIKMIPKAVAKCSLNSQHVVRRWSSINDFFLFLSSCLCFLSLSSCICFIFISVFMSMFFVTHVCLCALLTASTLGRLCPTRWQGSDRWAAGDWQAQVGRRLHLSTGNPVLASPAPTPASSLSRQSPVGTKKKLGWDVHKVPPRDVTTTMAMLSWGLTLSKRRNPSLFLQ